MTDAHARKILATEHATQVIATMQASEGGLWTEKRSAGLLLAALAAAQGVKPAELNDGDPKHELRELTNLYSAQRSAGDLGEIMGFVLAYGKDLGADRTIIEILPRLIHSGAEEFGDGLTSRDPLGFLIKELEKIVKEATP